MSIVYLLRAGVCPSLANRRSVEQSFDHSRFDVWWKWFLRQFLKEFLDLVAPDLYALIDWTRGAEFIDKELLPASPKSRSRRLYVDCLFKIYLNTGEAQLILIHIEIQAQREARFPKRMFRYFARLFLEYDLPIISFAVLVDEHPRWRPDTYEYALGGCELRFKYRVVKLLDLDRAQLEQSRNPASIMLLAFRQARETEGDMNLRLEARKQLAVLARERGYNEWLIARLDELLEGIMQLPESLEKEYERALEEYKQLKGSPFISAAERIGLRQGLLEGYQEGRADGLRDSINRLLKRKYGDQAEAVIASLSKVQAVDVLEQLYEAALDTDDIQLFQVRLSEYLRQSEE